MVAATMPNAQRNADRWGWRQIVLVAFLVFVFFTGGGSRDDIVSLLLLRPVAAIVLALGLLGLRWEHIQLHRWVFVLLGGLIVLHIIHLIPLPPGLWTQLPGREVAAQVFAITGAEQPWRPISLVPFRTWNSLFALIVPLAALVLLVQIEDPRIHRRLIVTLVALAAVSALFGLFQALAPANSGLYLYRISNRGLAVGLFANRNHNAAFVAIALPMIGFLLVGLRAAAARALAPENRRVRPSRPWLEPALIALGIALLPFVLLTGSRAGLLLAVIGAACALWLGGRGSFTQFSRQGKLTGVLVALFIALVALAIAFPTGTVMRVIELQQEEEFRFQAWPVILDVIGHYMPVGSGLGSFVETYRLAEPDALLQDKFLNHAHNDWLELVMDAGIPGAIILAGAVIAYAIALVRVLRADASAGLLARLGLAIVAMLALASAFDYPLRTPSLATVLTIAAVWIASYRGSDRVTRRTDVVADGGNGLG